jgi:hypothetical protein
LIGDGRIGKRMVWMLAIPGLLFIAICVCNPLIEMRNLKCGGYVVVLKKLEGEKVISYDDKGEISSESYYFREEGTYRDYVRLFQKFQAAIAKGDRDAVSKCMNYPVRVNVSIRKHWEIQSPEKLIEQFDKVFDPTTTKEILESDPFIPSSRNGETMLGRGVVWANNRSASKVGVAVVNQWDEFPFESRDGSKNKEDSEDSGIEFLATFDKFTPESAVGAAMLNQLMGPTNNHGK